MRITTDKQYIVVSLILLWVFVLYSQQKLIDISGTKWLSLFDVQEGVDPDYIILKKDSTFKSYESDMGDIVYGTYYVNKDTLVLTDTHSGWEEGIHSHFTPCTWKALLLKDRLLSYSSKCGDDPEKLLIDSGWVLIRDTSYQTQ